MRDAWYGKAADYWMKQEASVNGVLGGFGRLSGTDISGSKRFLEKLNERRNVKLEGTVLDCGGGIGRVSKELLLPKFRVVDLLEPAPNLINQARQDLQGEIRSYIEIPLQHWTGEAINYDLIWAQWVLLYLTDDDLIRFFKFAIKSLNGGVLCFKENVSSTGEPVIDEVDNSVTRTPQQYRDLVDKAGLEILLEMKQPMWPSDLFPVVMWAVRDKFH
jgi:protein N-terminal methyltransferase